MIDEAKQHDPFDYAVAVGGPFLAAFVVYLLTRLDSSRAQQRRDRMTIFSNLLMARSEFGVALPEHRRSIALIPIAFANVKDVLARLCEYQEAVDDSDIKRDKIGPLDALIKAMGKTLGYDIKVRAYLPKAMTDANQWQNTVNREWLRLLLASENLGTPRVVPPPPATQPQPPPPLVSDVVEPQTPSDLDPTASPNSD